MKMKYIDIAVTVIFIVAMIVIYFFWKCKWDLVVAVVAGIVVIIAGIVGYRQHKKIKELEDNQESK